MARFYRTNLLHIPVREQPSHRSQMVTQLLYGEMYEVLESSKDHWHRIRCRHDGYEGYIFTRFFAPIEFEESYLANARRTTRAYSPAMIASVPMLVGYGSWLLSHETVEKPAPEGTEETVVDHARRFINTPYLWGGRSIWGIDCSGLVQQVFATFGVALPRDSHQQAEEGRWIKFLEDAKPGDVAFFAEGGERITHTGILTGRGTIIHASEWVREDAISEEGIFNTALQQHTHQVATIRRFIEG